MSQPRSTGKCQGCGGVFDKAAITRHLKSCSAQRPAGPAPSGKRQPQKILHLAVEGRYLPHYWMHLEAPAKATLFDLDGFLRAAWLECCGHMSAFIIEGQHYSSSSLEEMEDRGLEAELGHVLQPKLTFRYEYDFGTTTELTLKVVGERLGAMKRGAVEVLARNEPPTIPCGVCGQPATQVCGGCGEGWLCAKCAPKHECGEDMLLPVVNSPRTGQCGYTGPA
jgi:hypothetical protein